MEFQSNPWLSGPDSLGVSRGASAPEPVGTGIREKLRMAVPVLTVMLGVLLVLRGLNLGIPYVSPRVEEGVKAEEVRCH